MKDNEALNREIAAGIADFIFAAAKKYFPKDTIFTWNLGIAHFIADLHHLADLVTEDWKEILRNAECFYAEDKQG